jgi:hypothetical protein
MWDCNAFLSKDLFHELLALEPPLKAIAISHPHVRIQISSVRSASLPPFLCHIQFYSTSLTWARCLRVPLIIAAADKHWFQRLSDVKEGEIEWFHNEASLEDGVNVIQCSGYGEGQLVPCRSIFADRFLLSRTGTSPDHRYYTGIGRWSRNSKAKSISAPASSCVRIQRWSNPHSRGLPSNGPCQTW